MKKILLIVVIIIIVAVILLYAFMGTIAKQGVQIYGSKIVGAPVAVKAINISPISGSLDIKDFSVDNPEGYSKNKAITFGSINVNFDTLSMLSNKKIINTIAITNTTINFETGLNGNNLRSLEKNINKNQHGKKVEKKAEKSEKPAEPEKAKPAKKQKGQIIIKDFVLENAKVNLRITSLGKTYTTVIIPTIHLTNLGEKSQINSINKTLTTITDAILKQVLLAAKNPQNFLKASIHGAGKKQIDNLVNTISNKIPESSKTQKKVNDIKSMANDLIGVLGNDKKSQK